MTWLTEALRSNPELAFFLVLALGFAIGQIRILTFQLGGVLGTLIAGLVIGQLGIPASSTMKNAFFVMFLFAVGFRTGPEFFRSLRSNALPQAFLAFTLCAVALVCALVLGRILGFDAGTTAGMLSGALTNSPSLGTATATAAALPIDPAAREVIAQNVGAAYALTYALGVILVVWFVPTIGPRLMRVNLRDACKAFEKSAGLDTSAATVNAAVRRMVLRAYEIPPEFQRLTVAALEDRWPESHRAVVARVRRGDQSIESSETLTLQPGDVVAVAGQAAAFVADVNPLNGHEVEDSALLALPAVTAELVITKRNLGGQTLQTIAELVGARGIFLSAVTRSGRDLPFTPSTVLERGDVLSVSGLRQEVSRIAALVGYAEYPSATTDLLLVAGTIFVGGMVGLPAIAVGTVKLSLSVAVGVLLGGLILGYLRSVHPRFGRIPEPSVKLLESLGLAGFLALIGLQAGPAAVTAFKTAGVAMLGATVVTTLLPHAVTILLGYYVVGMHPGILLGLCAGAGTSAGTLAATEALADSKVPTLGYGMSCALGNVLMAIWGALIISMSA